MLFCNMYLYFRFVDFSISIRHPNGNGILDQYYQTRDKMMRSNFELKILELKDVLEMMGI